MEKQCIFILKNKTQCSRNGGKNNLCWQHEPKFVENKDMCCICLNTIKYPLVISTVCTHTYCKGCFELWFEKNKNCPLCRAVMKTYNVQNTNKSTPEQVKKVKKEERRLRFVCMKEDPIRYPNIKYRS